VSNEHASQLYVSLLLNSVSHQLLLGTLRADDVLPVSNEPLADHATLAGRTDEAVIVPVATLKRNETGSADSSDRLTAGRAALAEQLTKAVGAVGLVVTRRESLPCQGLLAMGAGKALPMPRIVAVGNTPLGDHLATFDTFGRELLLVALGAVDVVLLGDEGLSSNWVLASAAHETLLVPLAGFVFHFLHTCFEHIATAITPRGELGVIARTAVDPVSFRAELFVNQAGPALVAEEAGLVPMLLLVGEILGVNSNNLVTFIAVIGKNIFIAFDAVRMIVSQDIPVPCKTVVTVMAKHGFNF